MCLIFSKNKNESKLNLKEFYKTVFFKNGTCSQTKHKSVIIIIIWNRQFKSVIIDTQDGIVMGMPSIVKHIPYIFIIDIWPQGKT